MTTPDNVTTLVSCPACALCAACSGRHIFICYRCVHLGPHEVTCSGCRSCGLCSGLHLVPSEVRNEWLNLRPTDPPPEPA